MYCVYFTCSSSQIALMLRWLLSHGTINRAGGEHDSRVSVVALCDHHVGGHHSPQTSCLNLIIQHEACYSV